MHTRNATRRYLPLLSALVFAAGCGGSTSGSAPDAAVGVDADGDAAPIDVAMVAPDAAVVTPDATILAPDAAADAAVPAESLADRLAALGAEPCADEPAFLCGTLEVPADHGAPPGGSTFPFAFGVRPATGASQGALVVVEGGPGLSGTADLDDLTWADERLSAHFDLVYFDLRGVRDSGALTCPEAEAAFAGANFHATDAASRVALGDAAAAFSAACAVEMGRTPAELVLFNTQQAVEDLDSLRAALGFETLTMYGLSYGTQFAQTYTTAHPERVRRLAIDGVVDLTRTDVDYGVDVWGAVEDVLGRTLAARPDAGAQFDAVVATLNGGPAAVEFPLADGSTRARTFTLADLDSLVNLAMYDPWSRAIFLRALAGTRPGGPAALDFRPLRRMLDGYAGIESETDVPYADDSFSNAEYYTITCNDYGRPAAGVSAYLDACAAAMTPASRTAEGCYSELPCATWPSAPDLMPRPPAFNTSVPVLIVNADADIATPVRHGRAVLEGLHAAGADVHEVAVSGGQHVMWGWDTCVTDAIDGFLLAADGSATADATCDAGVVGPYLDLSPATAAEYTTGEVMALSIVNELRALPDFPGPTAWGCDGGGALDIDEDGAITLDACAFVDGLTVDGTGLYDAETDALSFTVTVGGAGGHTGEIEYGEDESGYAVSGTWDGVTLGGT